MKKKDGFALVVSGLTDYTVENQDVLLVKAIFSGKTADLIRTKGTLMTGVKYAEKIALLASDAIFQDGSGCVRTSSGTTTLTQRTLTVGTIAVVEDICIPDLEKKYVGQKLAKGANQNALPFEQEYTEYKAAIVGKQLEIAIWQGDTTSSNANLNKFDGYIKIIDASGVAINANVANAGSIIIATGITTANVKLVVDSMWLSLPADIMGKDDIGIFCGWDVFNKFIASYRDQNLFNFAPTGSEVSVENGTVIIPGTNYKLMAVHGLDGTNRLFAMEMYQMVAGTDLEHDYEEFMMKPDQFNNYLHFQMRFRYGVQVGFPDQIVTFKLV
jgi:hypothetical protein